jgi:glycosyltransferase involved in cell wall biosynthesis
LKISLITATYNSEKHIVASVESLLNQSYSTWEHLLVDGNSGDNTVEKIKETSPLTIIASESDKGLYDALNKGVSRATGEVVGFLHSDDAFASETVLDNVAAVFNEDSKIEAVYGDLNYLSADFTKVVRKWKSGLPTSFKGGWMPPHPALFVKKSVFDKVGLFRLDLGSAADYEWMLRAFEVHNIKAAYVPDVLVNMRIGGMSNENIAARKNAFSNDLKAWEVNGFKKNYLAVLLKKLRKIPQYF